MLPIKLRDRDVEVSRFSVRTTPVGGVNDQRNPVGADSALPIFRLAAPDRKASVFAPYRAALSD